MHEYINREAFLRQEREAYCRDCDHRKNGNGKVVYEIGGTPCRACEICYVLDDAEDFPAADVVERRTGRWLRFSRCDVCSECRYATGRYEHGGNYCPNCGADMREARPTVEPPEGVGVDEREEET